MAHVELKRGVLERVKKSMRDRAKRVSPHRLSVGIQPPESEQQKLDYSLRPGAELLGLVARWMEYGTDKIPERPIMRQWFDANERRLRREMTAATRREYLGNKTAVQELGRKWADELREFYLSGDAKVVPLATVTIGRKASAGLDSPEIPVVATHQLANAVRAVELKR